MPDKPTCPLLAERPMFTGWHGRYHRGHARCIRAAKRWEAAERATCTRRLTGACTHPGKKIYGSMAEVNGALRHMPHWRKSQRLNPYQCPAGHWHLGRIMHRASAVWRKK